MKLKQYTLLYILMTFLLAPVSVHAESYNKKRVLHITSYSSELKWERDIIAGVKEGIGTSDDILYYKFNLNSHIIQNKENQNTHILNNIHNMIIEQTPHVVIASDNDALDFVIENYQQLFNGAYVPIVFCGINNFSHNMLRNISQYATGCSESLSVSGTIKSALNIYPNTKNIYVVNDYTNTGRLWYEDIVTQFNKLKLNVNILHNDNITIQSLLDEISSLDDDTLILLGWFFTDSENIYSNESEIQKKIHDVSKTPVMTFLGSAVGNGTLGGMVSSGISQGRIAGEMSREVLEGNFVLSINKVLASESLNEWVFDYNIINEFDINRKLLPNGYLEINRKPPIWESFDFTIMFLVCLFLLSIITTLVVLIIKTRKHNSKLLVDIESINDSILNNYTPKSGFEHLQGIIENVPMSLAIVIDSTIIGASEYCQNEIGMAPGLPIRSFYKNPAIFDKALRDLDTHKFVSGEIVNLLMKNNKSHRHIINYGQLNQNGSKVYLIFAIDVEESERQKEYIKRSQNDLQKIIDALPTALAIINTTTIELEYANYEYLTLYGYETVEEAKLFIDFNYYAEQFFALWQGSTVEFQCTEKLQNGREIFLKMYADQIVFFSKNCIVLIARDISAEQQQAQMLKRAAEKEREANQLKGVFLANMSHEIRTPMNAIIGLSQLALMKTQTPENSDLFYKISSSAKNLLSIINDILDFSKIEAEKLDFVEEEFSLEDTISNAFLVAAERVEDKNVEILLDAKPNVPCWLYGDKTRLWQVLKNILDNSVKYTKAGRIVLSISVKSDGDNFITLLFHIKDTGIGMTSEQLERLFMPFEQFNRNNSKKAGTGLGMSITKQLVKMMNGEIHVESEVDIGTSFYVTIPFRRAINHKTLEEFAEETIGSRIEAVGCVLLVDDDECSLFIMSSILKSVNIDSVCVSNGDDAIKMVTKYRDEGKPFNVIILDYILGDENGIDLANKINSMSQNTKLLLVTAYAKRIISDSTLKEAGFQDVIEKPFVVSSFLQKVCSVIPDNFSDSVPNHPSYSDAQVLLCEDNELNQMVASGLLESYDIYPVIAENGREALDILEKQNFDLIFMDITMPIMDGHETTKAIRQSNKPYKDVTIIAMTANVMADEVSQCLEEGMNAHIEKPIDIKKFDAILAKYLS